MQKVSPVPQPQTSRSAGLTAAYQGRRLGVLVERAPHAIGLHAEVIAPLEFATAHEAVPRGARYAWRSVAYEGQTLNLLPLAVRLHRVVERPIERATLRDEP